MKIPKLLIPVLVIITLLTGYQLRHAFTQPTTAITFDAAGEAKLVCIVDGLKCKGTANFFTSLFEDTEGIASLETVASEHKAMFTYDPSLISKEKIQSTIEQEIELRDGSSRQIFKCISVK